MSVDIPATVGALSIKSLAILPGGRTGGTRPGNQPVGPCDVPGTHHHRLRVPGPPGWCEVSRTMHARAIDHPQKMSHPGTPDTLSGLSRELPDVRCEGSAGAGSCPTLYSLLGTSNVTLPGCRFDLPGPAPFEVDSCPRRHRSPADVDGGGGHAGGLVHPRYDCACLVNGRGHGPAAVPTSAGAGSWPDYPGTARTADVPRTNRTHPI